MSTPDGFLSRASWNDLFLTSIPESADTTAGGGEDYFDKVNDDSEKDHAGDGGFPKGKEAGPKSVPPKQGKRSKSSGTQHATEGECLDFMDKEEELETVMHFALQTTFHRMFGPLDTATDKAGSSPPTQINFYP